MDRISFLPDDVLLHLLSLLTTKDVLKTSVLSKRWRNLWKLVPKLKYIDCDENADHGRFLLFVDRSLLLNKAPVLESLRFKFRRQCSDVDIGFWVRFAAERGLRDFYYCHSVFNEPSRLPQRLFTCGTLVVLKLTNVSLADVKFPVSFPFLKTLDFRWVIYLDDESPRKLLSSCPILEVLILDRQTDDNVTTFSIMVPSLQKLTYSGVSGDETDFVLNAPSLNFLEISDLGYECMIEKLPEIVAANVEVIYWNTDNILGSLTSVKRLSLCLPSESPFPTGEMFHQLVDLEFCTCATEWELLMSFLKYSPKLRTLKLNEKHGCHIGELWDNWDDEPRSVPETLMFGLETLELRNYRGWLVEKQLATFLLKHSFHLKRAIFSSVDTNLENENEMLIELALLPRGSKTCQLVFSQKFETI